MRLTRHSRNLLVVALALGLAALLGEGVGPRTAWGQDELFVANFGNNSITVYSRTAGGNIAPTRTLTGAATGLSGPVGLVVDTVNNELVVANNGNNSITVYPRTASGNTAPIRILSGAATGLSVVQFIAVTPAQTRDFNGDGTADILWRHTSGAVALWFMNGAAIASVDLLPSVTTDWTIVGVGDVNGDGRPDILWRHTSGAVALWLMNGPAIIGTSVLGTVTTDWTIVGVGG